MKRILYKLTDWLVKVTKYPTIQCNNTIIEIKDCERIRCQQLVPFDRLQQLDFSDPGVIPARIRNEIAVKVADHVIVSAEQRPDGVLYSADIFIKNYPKNDKMTL